jgi:hypothetical protein
MQAAGDARSVWLDNVTKDVSPDSLPSVFDLHELREVVRDNIHGWGKRLEESRNDDEIPHLGEYTPDQQGCYERTTRRGGTLSVSDSESKDIPVNRLRMGCAKTKGKMRVVTMQTARAKRVLTPVHNALYNHISSQDWCVRGSVEKGDFDAVAKDLRKGESYISGDYQAATDNIFLCAVEVIVDEVSKSKELTEEERDVLKESFHDLEVKAGVIKGAVHVPVKRGSMMGNLVSFPLLCLLNKSCFDMACRRRSPKGKWRRVGKFNGDDCMFAGDAAFMTLWRHITAKYGLIVNEEKTGFSRRWLELNSQSYDVRAGSLVSKPVLSFLLPSRNCLSGLLTQILEGTKSFSRSVTKRVLGVMRYEISARGVVEDLSSLTPYWRKVLVRFRWFRAAALLGGAPVTRVGVDRSLPVEVGPPPYPAWYPRVNEWSAKIARDRVKEWKGVRIRSPLTQTLDMKAFRAARKLPCPGSLYLRKFVWIGFEWAFVWPKELLRDFRDFFPQALMTRRDCIRTKWLEDHPFLTRRSRVGEVGKVRTEFQSVPCPPCLAPKKVWDGMQAPV